MEFLLRLFVLERVQQGDAALKRLLHRWRAGYRKNNRPELRRRKIFLMMMALLVIGYSRAGKESERNGA